MLINVYINRSVKSVGTNVCGERCISAYVYLSVFIMYQVYHSKAQVKAECISGGLKLVPF